MRPVVLTVAMLAGIATTIGACGSTSTPRRAVARTATPRPPETATATAVVTPVPTATPGFMTGAPLVVQIENTAEARPQSGLSAATILYEYVAEGGVSRLSAVYATPPTVVVGPVRSARLVAVQITKNLQGVLAYSGASTYINGQLATAGVAHYNEDTAQGNLFRITSRVPPHNLYTDGAHLAALLRLSGAPLPIYGMWPARAATAPGGRPASSVTVTVSMSETPLFTWDGARGGYVDHEAEGLMSDADTHNPLVAPTVVVQQVPIATAPQVVDVNGVTGVSHDLAGTGAAQVFTASAEYDATWTQPATGGPPLFTLASGAPAPINTGLVWILLVPVGGSAGFH